jgi:multidrug resistance efflux pump
MEDRRRISVSWRQRGRQFRQNVLPALTFSACVVCTAWLWQRNGAAPAVIGEVEAVRANVVAGADGILLPRPQGPWTLFDRVEANQILARVDDRLVQAQLEASRRQLAQLRAQLGATSAEAELAESVRRITHRREAVRLAWELQTRRLALLDRVTTIEADRIEMRRLTMRLEYLEPLLKEQAVSELDVLDTKLMRDTVDQRIKKAEQALAESRKQLDQANARLQAFPEHVATEVDRLIAPVREQITVQEALVDQLKIQIKLLEIRAPFSGTVTAIFLWPGQTIKAGDPIVTVAAEEGRYVVGYVRDDQRFRPEVGMPIDVRTRTQKPVGYTSHVERVGPQVELVAQHLLRLPTQPEWGIPVRIAMPAAADLRPGELVEIRFK